MMYFCIYYQSTIILLILKFYFFIVTLITQGGDWSKFHWTITANGAILGPGTWMGVLLM